MSEDAISREAAIDACDQSINMFEATDRIKELPSVTPKPCEDAISRQAAIEKINEYIDEYSYVDAQGNHELKWCAMQEAKMMLEDLPSVTPKQRTGHWIDTADEINAIYSKHDYKCSKCGKYAEYFIAGTEDWWSCEKPNYCPNCGAKMVEPQESEEHA